MPESGYGPSVIYTAQEFYANRVDLSVDAGKIITSRRSILRGIYVNVVMNAFAVDIMEVTSGSVVFIIPASVPAGSWIPLGDVTFKQGIKILPNASSTGNITVIYKQMGDN